MSTIAMPIAETTAANTDDTIANDFEITANKPEEENVANTTPDEDEGEQSIMLSVLDELGLTEEYKEAYSFDDDIDIDTPTGLKQVVQNTLMVGGQMFYDEQIKSNPELHSLYLHYKNGGTLSSFRNDETIIPSLEQVEKSVDLQIQEYKKFLTEAGNDKEDIETLVANAIKNETIKDKSLNYVSKKIEKREQTNVQVQQEIEQKENLERQVVSNAINVISQLIRENEFSSGIKLTTDTKKEEFYASLKNNLVYEDGQVYYNVQLTDKNLKDVMEQHFLLNNKKAKELFYAGKEKIKQEMSLKNKNQPKTATTIAPNINEGKISASNFIMQM